MSGGWIKVHRKLLESPIYSNAGMLKLWIHCLLKASHTEHEHLVGMQLVKLKPGQFVTGREALAEEFNKGAKKKDVVSAITLWRWLLFFEEMQMLNIKKTTKFSVVTVINWCEYQSAEQQVNNKRTTSEQQMNTNKNVKNDKNEKNNISRKSTKRFYEDDSDEIILVNHFIKYIRMNDEKFKNPNKQKWADDIRKIIELDGRDKREVARVIVFAQQHDFWKANILSPAKLREKYSTLILQMNRPSLTQPIHPSGQAPLYKEYVHDPNRGEE